MSAGHIYTSTSHPPKDERPKSIEERLLLQAGKGPGKGMPTYIETDITYARKSELREAANRILSLKADLRLMEDVLALEREKNAKLRAAIDREHQSFQ